MQLDHYKNSMRGCEASLTKVYTLFAVILFIVPMLAVADSYTTDSNCQWHGTCIESTAGVCAIVKEPAKS